jgi:hypothetical protein
LIELDNTDTRDCSTLQGAINTLNDTINKFDDLIPGDITVIDNYGRIASAGIKTDDHLNVIVNGSINNSQIAFKHNASGVSGT